MQSLLQHHHAISSKTVRIAKKFTTVAFAVAFMALALLTSCNKADNALMDNIPADATFVAVVNVEEIAKNAGCEVSSSGIKLSPEVKPLFEAVVGQQLLNNVTTILPYIDARHVMAFDEKQEFILTYLISDADAYAKAMEEAVGHPQSNDGFTVYAGRLVTVVKGHQAWTMEGTPDHVISVVDRVLDKAAEDNFTTHHGLAEYIDESEAVGMVVNLAALGMKDNGTWLGAHFKFESMSAQADIQLMLSDGEIVPVDGFCNIDSDFLRYVPADFNYALAIGVESGATLAGWLQMVMPMMPFEQRGMLDAVMPFLSRIKGTVAVAGLSDGLPADDSEIAPLLVMAHMDQDDVNASVQELVNLVRGMGASVSPAGEGRYVVTAPGLKVYIGNVDGNLGLSTIPFESTRENSMAPAFGSRFGGAYFMMPGGYRGIFDRPVQLKANLQPQFMQIEMIFPDTKGPFLKTCLESITSSASLNSSNF